MTRIERLEKELEKLYAYRAAAMRRNDMCWLSANQRKIDEKEKELIEARSYHPRRLSEELTGMGDDVKNSVYKALLKISLASDYLNETAEDAKSLLAEIGLADCTFRKDLETLRKLSLDLASFVIIPGQDVLTDMIVDNAEFIDTCAAAADKHLKEKLNL